MKLKRIVTIVVVVLLVASVWLVLHPVQPWPAIDGADRYGSEMN